MEISVLMFKQHLDLFDRTWSLVSGLLYQAVNDRI
jgi:hypothetical protein